MRLSFLSSKSWRWARSMTVLALLNGTMFAQATSASDSPLNLRPINLSTVDPAPLNPGPAGSGAVAASPVVASAVPEAPSQHRFWDNQNRTLFATVAALSAADFSITRGILTNGGKELNPLTRLFSGSTAALAANFAGETAGIIGLSYYFHKTGHHQLERITPMLDIGASSFAVVYDLSHR
jgi:hypothetical protein